MRLPLSSSTATRWLFFSAINRFPLASHASESEPPFMVSSDTRVTGGGGAGEADTGRGEQQNRRVSPKNTSGVRG